MFSFICRFRMNPKVVIRLLVQKFGTSDDAPSIADREMFDQICAELLDERVIVERYESLTYEDASDLDVDSTDREYGDEDIDMTSQAISTQHVPEVSDEEETPSSQGSSSSYVPSPERKKKGVSELSEEYKERAFQYWTSTVGGKRRSLASVRSKFSKIKSIGVLQNYERSREKMTSRVKMSTINTRVFEHFKEMSARNAIIHDRTIRQWALQIKRQVDPDDKLNFKASDSWIYKFKKRNRIVSRSITHKVSKTCASKEEDIQRKSDEFVRKMKSLFIERHLVPKQILNTDQSRFEKEMHSGRTLRPMGIKRVYATVGSTSATTHSYMIMPVISMDGDLHSPMYMLCAESSRKFPQSKPADPSNIMSYASGSANMKKEDQKIMLTNVFWPSVSTLYEEPMLLLLDSWSANTDEVLIKSTIPESISEFEWHLIPPGCTGLIQPLDVYFFRPYKAFVKFVTDAIIATEEFNIWHRDNFIRLQSFTHYQFSSPMFRNMIKYAWYKSGYLDEEPEPFRTPMQYCCDTVGSEVCSSDQCSAFSFMRCAHCNNTFCLNHLLIDSLHINCT